MWYLSSSPPKKKHKEACRSIAILKAHHRLAGEPRKMVGDVINLDTDTCQSGGTSSASYQKKNLGKNMWGKMIPNYPLVKSMFWSSGPLRIPAHPRRPCCLGRALCARVSPVSLISLCCFFTFCLLGFSPVSHFKKSYFRSIYKPKLGVWPAQVVSINLKESSVFGTIGNKKNTE